MRMTVAEVLAEGNRQAASQDGSHVVLDGYEWAILIEGLEQLQRKAEGLLEIIERYEEIKAKAGAQVLAGDAIRKASGS